MEPDVIDDREEEAEIITVFKIGEPLSTQVEEAMRFIGPN